MKNIDYILSVEKNRIAKIDLVVENEFTFSGTIIEDNIPLKLKNHIINYNKMIDEGVFSVLDEIESEIYKYDLKLEIGKKRIHHITIEDNKISFFTLYPTSSGFLEDWPLR